MVSTELEKTCTQDFEKSSDFANYFCTYAYLYHQKQMLMDNSRMQKYQDSIFLNKDQFKDKVVLDVGTGSGILSIWAAQAGARKVYAVEATDMAKHARNLIQHNKLSDVITVIQSKVEDIELPEKVDIIISEWMGYFLLRESMLDSVLYARDKFLQPDGALYPSHCTMYIGAVSETEHNLQRRNECENGLNGWHEFVEFTKDKWGVDMDCLSKAFREEQEQYSLYTSNWVEMDSTNLITEPCAIKSIDILTCTLDDIKQVTSEFELTFSRASRFGGICGWFDVDFHGSPNSPVENSVTLCTSPFVEQTHWGQQLFSFPETTSVYNDDRITGQVRVVRRNDNQRLMNVQFQYTVDREGQPKSTKESRKTVAFQIE